MKKIILLLMVAFILFAGFVSASNPGIVPEGSEFQVIYEEMMQALKEANSMTEEGSKIHDCYSQYHKKAEKENNAYQKKMKTRENRIDACVEVKIPGGTGYGSTQARLDCFDEINKADAKEHYGVLLPLAKECQLCMGLVEPPEIKISITIEKKILLANGQPKSKVTVSVSEDEAPAANKSVRMLVIDESGILKSAGLLSKYKAPTNARGRADLFYIAPAIGDPNFTGTDIKIQASYMGTKASGKITLEETPLIQGEILDIKDKPFPKVPVIYDCVFDEGKFKNKIEADKEGKFYIPGQEKKLCTVRVAQGFKDYVMFRRKNIAAPHDFGKITIATKREFEKRMTREIVDFLIDSGISEEEANEKINGIPFSYDGTTPAFQTLKPNPLHFTGVSEMGYIEIPGEQYWTDCEWFTLFHEYGHAAMYGFAHDEGADLKEGHDIWMKTNRDTAFDEARAHFFAMLMLSSTDKNDKIASEFTKTTSNGAINKERAAGNNIEGVIATFWKQLYGSQMYSCPNCVFKNFMEVQDEFKKKNGRPPRTIEEWIDGQQILRADNRTYQIANDYKINHNGDIETGLGEEKTKFLSLQIDNGGKMDILLGMFGDREMVSGTVDIIADYTIESKGASGKIIYPDGSYIKIRPGARIHVFEYNEVIVRHGKVLIYVWKDEDREGEFEVTSPNSKLKAKVKGTTFEFSVDESDKTTIKLVKGSIDLVDLEDKELDKLSAGEQYDSSSKLKSKFDVNEILDAWQEEKESFWRVWVIGIIIFAGVLTATIFFKKNKNMKTVLVLILIIAFALLAGGIYWLQSGQETSESKTGDVQEDKAETKDDEKIEEEETKTKNIEDDGKIEDVDETKSAFKETPIQVVEKFMNHTLGTLPDSKIDYDKARQLMTDELRKENSGDYFVPNFYGIQDGPDSVEVTLENTSGGSSAVKVDAHYGNMATAWAFILTKEDNKWLISGFRNDAQ